MMRINTTLPLAFSLVAGCMVPTDVRLSADASDAATDRADAPSAMDGSDGGQLDDVVSDRSLDASEPMDTGIADTGIADTGIADTGIADTGIADTGVSAACLACPLDRVCAGVMCETVGTPSALAPTALAIVAARFPRILFNAGADSDRTRVDFCVDAACATIERSAIVMHGVGAVNQAYVPTDDVFPDGRRRFWRVVAGNARGFARQGTTPRAIHRAGPGSRHASLRGWVVGYAQDFNNDGNADLAVSAGGALDRFRAQPGGVYMFAGLSSGAALVQATPTTSVGVSISPALGPPAFGLRSFGDVNGDGFADCSWSAHTGLEPPGTIGVRGGIELFHGGVAPLASTRSVEYGAGDHDYHVEAGVVGDVNSDGINDALIGAAGDPQPALRVRGRSVLYLGSRTGLVRSAVTLDDPLAWPWRPFYTGDLDDDGVAEAGLGFGGTGPRSLRVYSGTSAAPLSSEAARIPAVVPATDNQFGHAAVVGDIDDDGLLDLVAAGQSGQRMYVFSQSAMNARTFNTTPRYTLSRPASAGAGWSVALDALGDVNNDGIADFIVAADGARAGAAVVYLGRSAQPPQPVVIDVPAGDRRAALVYNNSVAGLTDFNGDGRYEFALGVPNAGQTADNTGYVYIYGWDAMTSSFVVRQRVDISSYVTSSADNLFFGQGMR